MHRIWRASIAMLLSFAFAGAPVIAEQCLASCEAAHMAAMANSPAHAGHQHAPVPHSSIGQAPVPCGHDHNGITGVASPVDTGQAKALVLAVSVLIPASPSVHFVSMPARNLHSSGSSGTTPHTVSSPIRT